MQDVRYALSPIVRHIKPVAVEVLHSVNGRHLRQLLSVEEALSYVIRKFVQFDSELSSVHLDFDRIIFDDNSSCYGAYFIQKKFNSSSDMDGEPYAVYLCARAAKEECIVASMLVE